MKRTKTILASLVLAVSVAAVALTAWVNRPTDSFFEANLEALANTEEVIGVGPLCVYDLNSWCVYLFPYDEYPGIFYSDDVIIKQ